MKLELRRRIMMKSKLSAGSVSQWVGESTGRRSLLSLGGGGSEPKSSETMISLSTRSAPIVIIRPTILPTVSQPVSKTIQASLNKYNKNLKLSQSRLTTGHVCHLESLIKACKPQTI